MFPKGIKCPQVLNWTFRKGVKTVSLGSLVTDTFYLAHKVFLNIIRIFMSLSEPYNLHPPCCLKPTSHSSVILFWPLIFGKVSYKKLALLLQWEICLFSRTRTNLKHSKRDNLILCGIFLQRTWRYITETLHLSPSTWVMFTKIYDESAGVGTLIARLMSPPWRGHFYSCPAE